jgi:predicted acylesterase/phospholipase RssA/CRP-like cAMP-binding protein
VDAGVSPASAGAPIFEDILRRAAVLRAELQRAVDIFVHGRARPAADDRSDGDVDAVTLELTIDGWSQLVPDDPAVRNALRDLVVARFGPALADCPRVVDLLEVPLDDAAVRGPLDETSLERALERIELPGGATLFEQGQEGDSLYVISRGRLQLVLVNGDGAVTRDLGPDQTVGELALLTGDVRQGTVVAVRDSVLYRLDRGDFERCVLTEPAITHTMLLTQARRLSRPPVRRSAVPPTNIAVLPAGTDAPVRAFADALWRFLAAHVPTALVSAESVEEAVGSGAVDADPTSPLGIRVDDHLGGLEERYAHVVRVAGADTSPWNLRCVREADLILLVGGVRQSPALTPLEHASHTLTRARRQLVLVEPVADATPQATAAWLAEREVDLCHHVHLDWPSHFARLARFLVGAPVGLVLSGGAARAYAHVGVLRALRAAAIPIDIIAGTSAGALIGGQFAMGWSPEHIEQVGREVFGGPRRQLLDFVPPFTSLIGSTRFNAALDRIFGDVRFEDLWIQFLCTTTDLTSAAGRTHRRGRLRPSVRASCSLPMLMPPVIDDGHLLADGGIINNLPVDALLGVSSVGTLIAVNVANEFYRADEAYNYVDALTTRRLLNSRLNPFAERLVAPGMFDVLMRALEIGSKSLEAAQVAKADMYIRPDVARFGYTNVAAMSEIVAAGERAAAVRLGELGVPSIPFTR